jgi:chromosome segregation ATPase
MEERLQALIRHQGAELSARVAATEQRLDRQEWGREALIGRLNHQDARDEALSLNLEDLGSRQSRIESRTEEMLGLAWDAVAVARRIAVLEDRTEALLAKLETESAVVPYPDAAKLAS